MTSRTHISTATGGVEYIDGAQLRTRYGGRSDMWLYRMGEKEPTFPRPIKIGARNFWRLADIIAYEDRKRATA